MMVNIDGKEHRVPSLVFQGALSWTTHSLLTLMKREWDRPLAEVPEWERVTGGRPSQRMLIVVLFWTLFEHHMDRLLDAGLATTREAIRADLLRRYSSIGSRMDRLYKLTFNATMRDDLGALGFAHVFDHLSMVRIVATTLFTETPRPSTINLFVRWLSGCLMCKPPGSRCTTTAAREIRTPHPFGPIANLKDKLALGLCGTTAPLDLAVLYPKMAGATGLLPN